MQYAPNHSSPTVVLTNGLDSVLRVVDLRAPGAVVCECRSHPQDVNKNAAFSTSQPWSAAVWSPNGQYAAAGSNSATGTIFVWDLNATTSLKGKATKKAATLKLQTSKGHAETGICAIDWGSSNSSGGPQVASLDRRGCLTFWS